MIRYSLRAHRTGLIASASLAALYVLLQAPGYASAAGSTPAERQRFAASMGAIARQVSYILPLPTHLEVLSGYVQWRVFGFLAVVFATWAVFAGAGASRGEEDRGLSDQLLAGGMSRARLVLTRFAVFAAVAAGAGVVTTLATQLGGVLAGGRLDPAATVEDCAALWALSLTWFGFGLLAGQLTGTAAAARGLAAGVMVALLLLNGLARTDRSLDGAAWLSPFHLYDRTNALAPGGSLDVAATTALAVAGLCLAGLAALAYAGRDAGAPLLAVARRAEPEDHRPSANPLLRSPVTAALWEQRLELVGWLAAILLLAVLMVSLTRSSVDAMARVPSLAAFFALTGRGNVYESFLGYFWFDFAALLAAAYTITRVSRWAADDGEGRLELVLSQPVPRWRVVLERAVELGVAVALMVGAGSVVVTAAAPAQGIPAPPGDVVRATALLVPVALCFGAVGAAVAALAPRLAVALLATVAVFSYLFPILPPLFHWPAWLENLSIFRLYGRPLTEGVSWSGLGAMLAIIASGFGGALLLMERREVGR